MPFLCPKHKTAVVHNENTAHELWQGAVLNGDHAFNRCQFERARAFFGCAFEIAKIRLVAEPCVDDALITPQHLTQASSRLVNTLYMLDDFRSAEQCLLEQHYLLLFFGVDEHQPQRWQRQALELLDQQQSNLLRLLKRHHQHAKASSLQLLTQKLRGVPALH